MVWILATGNAQPGIFAKVTVTRDDTEIKESCIVDFAGPVADVNGDGVIHITGSGITVWFAPGAVMQSGMDLSKPELLSGMGIVISGKNVTLKRATIRGYKVGISAEGADGLTIDEATISDMYRARLYSTPQAEDQRDWLWPHTNDGGEWLKNYGAGVHVRSARDVVIEGVKVRRAQNGIMLDGVNDSEVYSNDCSFLSGWGLSMWRSSGNMVSLNAFNFCVRGYSHGVYNRGQDSAGILAFEQCSNNKFVRNSATHGGDGFFGFAGNEALGVTPAPSEAFDYKRRGCNDNVFELNDFSYAAAHGFEMTFSFGNTLELNRISGNGICGIWAGYSQGTSIRYNQISNNGLLADGSPGLGSEGGGINIEHGAKNQIFGNEFDGNSRAVVLWWDDDGKLLRGPWAKSNGHGSEANLIVGNRFSTPGKHIFLRATQATLLGGNFIKQQAGDEPAAMKRGEPITAEAVEADEDSQFDLNSMGEINDEDLELRFQSMDLQFGLKKWRGNDPRGLAGRANIIMTEYGPWDHESPLVRLGASSGWADRFELHKLSGNIQVSIDRGDDASEEDIVGLLTPPDPDKMVAPLLMDIRSARAGVWPYALIVKGDGIDQRIERTLINARWEVKCFTSPCDPREDLAAWRAGAAGPTAVSASLPRLALPFGMGGPSQLAADKAAGFGEALSAGLMTAGEMEAIVKADLPKDRFGVIATTVVPLKPGRWRIVTNSDDGIRVQVRQSGAVGPAGSTQTVIDNWTHHGPTTDRGEFVVGEPGDGKSVNADGKGDGGAADRIPSEITVEYFELDGFATLEFGLEPVTTPIPAKNPESDR